MVKITKPHHSELLKMQFIVKEKICGTMMDFICIFYEVLLLSSAQFMHILIFFPSFCLLPFSIFRTEVLRTE